MRRDACWSRNCADSYPASFSRCPFRPQSARASLLARPSKRYARMYSPNVMEATLHASASYLRNRKRVKSASRWWAMWRFRRKRLWRYYRLGNEFMRNAETDFPEKAAGPGHLLVQALCVFFSAQLPWLVQPSYITFRGASIIIIDMPLVIPLRTHATLRRKPS